MQRPWVTSVAYDAAIAVVIEARRTHGLSQRGLADRLNKPRSFVSKIESKERRLDFVELIAIARALQILPADLIMAVNAALPEHVDF